MIIVDRLRLRMWDRQLRMVMMKVAIFFVLHKVGWRRRPRFGCQWLQREHSSHVGWDGLEHFEPDVDPFYKARTKAVVIHARAGSVYQKHSGNRCARRLCPGGRCKPPGPANQLPCCYLEQLLCHRGICRLIIGGTDRASARKRDTRQRLRLVGGGCLEGGDKDKIVERLAGH